MYEHGNRIITCTNNKDNISIEFNEREFSPFILASASGIYDYTNRIYKSDNTVIDGAEYLGSVMEFRNIVLILKDIDDYEQNREIIDRVFPTGIIGTLTVNDGEHIRSIEYFTESVSSTATVNSRLTTISLICPDPHFYDPKENIIRIAVLTPNFTFPHEFVEEGEEFSFQNPTRIGTIENTNAEEYTGMTIVIEALDTVVNPSVVKIQTQEVIKVGNPRHTLTMVYGDILTITTQTGNKNVTYTHGRQTIDVNHYLTSDSEFFQLTRGTNSIGYNADSGRDDLMVTIVYRNRFARA